MHFALLYSPGPAWLSGKPLSEQPLAEHVEYLTRLHREGTVVMGGPFEDGSGGLVVADVQSPEEAQDVVAANPGVRSGILVASVKKWSRIV